MNKKLWAVLALVTMVAMVAVACGPTPTEAPPPPTEAPATPTEAPTEAPPPPPEKLKVAFVYVAPIGDLGWTWAHEQGRLMVEEELGIETAYIENVPEGPDAERVIRDFAQKGYDLVFATSFGFMDPMVTVASEFPDKYFEHCSGYKTADNMATYFGRMYQPRFLSGLVAGKATQTNKIGYVAAFPIPEVLRGINAFTLGVREANPEATVNVVWTNTWFDPVLEKEAAEALLDQGCDVIAQHQDTTEPQKAAQERGMVSIGYDSDMSQFVGDTVLTSPIWNWGPYYVERTKAVMDGTWETHQYWGGMKEGIVDLAPLSDKVPDDVKALAEEWKQKILSGEWDVFTGPIKGQNGELSIPAGMSMTDEEMLSMEWFVEGVVGEAPSEPPVAEAVPAKELKAAFVYVAPIGDLGWTWAHEQGRLMVEEELGIETAYIENVPEGPDAERVIRDFAQKGYDLVFATSFGFMDPMVTVAGEFPDKYFEHCSGYKTADNMATYFGRMYQPRFLSGLVAGKATQTNKIGYVAAFPIPEVLRGINAFTLGVREANPEATVNVVWTNTWFDPVLEKEAAEALLDQGCDVIAQHQDTTEPQKAAQEREMVSIGYDSDMSQFVGDTVLTSPIWNWGPYYVERAEAIMNGTWETHQYWGGMTEGIVDLAPLSDKVPDDVEALVEKWKQKILSGEWDVFTGPINGQNGELSIPADVSMTDEEMLSMDWFVEGVVGEAPGEPPVAEAVAVEKPRVAFVYVGPVGDMGWTYAHDQGRLYLEKELGVETAYSELVSEGPDSTRVIRDYAEKGYDVVFATSFGYMDSVIEVAAEYPDTVFEHCTGYKTADNAGIYDGRGYQGWYLAGIVAGKMTKNNVLGYIAPYPIPEVVRNMNAFTLGALSVNPDVETHMVWINTWVDPPKEREAAQALADLGADVIARESDSTEPDKLAQELGLYSIGYNAYVPDAAPDALLTAPIWNWGIFYKKAVEDVMNGTWTPEPVWWGLKEGLLELAPIADFVPDDVKALVEEKKAEIVAGEFDVFVGPIKDNTGELRVPEGETMTDEEKLVFDWLVEGVVGTVPK